MCFTLDSACKTEYWEIALLDLKGILHVAVFIASKKLNQVSTVYV